MQLNRAFFPLRSNAGWFQSLDLQAEIVNRLKLAMLLYDEIIIEDGTLKGNVLEDFSTLTYLPPGTLPDKERAISIEKDIVDMYVRYMIQPNPGEALVPLAQGHTISRFKVDYYSILADINSMEIDFITYITISDSDLPKDLKTLIQQNTSNDQRIFREANKNIFLRNLVIKGLNRDLVISSALGAGLVVDPAHQLLLEQKSRLALKDSPFLPDPKYSITHHLISVRVPHFNQLSLQQVIELRQDFLWEAFREGIRQIANRIVSEPEILTDQQAYSMAVRDAIDQELFQEIENRTKSGVDLSADFILGGFSLVPPIGTLATGWSMVKSLTDFYEQRRGWIAFLMKVSKRASD